MHVSTMKPARGMAALAALVAWTALALPGRPAAAQKLEQPPSFNAAQITGIKRVGLNYTIRNPVGSDGLLRVYMVDTPYGQFTVHSDEMMKMRINELGALAALEKVSNSQTFARAMAEAGLSPLKFTGQLIINPAKTMNETVAGINAFFGRMGAGLNNAGRTRDQPLDSLLGVTDQRRALAATYGVDPYTDFAPLAAKLEQLSQAAAMGGLVVSGALIAVPGAAGLVVSNLSTANKLNNIGIEDLARGYTAAQIMDLNRGMLAKMGIEEGLRERFLTNRNFTPIDMAAFVAALDSMPRVEGREIFVERAAEADSRTVAYLIRRRAEMMAADNRRHGGYVRFVDLGYPFVLTRDGRVLGLAPVDAVSWTKQTANGFDFVTAARKRAVPKGRAELRMTGAATGLAKRELKARGWTVLERQRL